MKTTAHLAFRLVPCPENHTSAWCAALNLFVDAAMFQKPSYSVLVSQLLRDRFTELLLELPDQFFELNDIQKELIWHQIYRRLLSGQIDISELAAITLPQHSPQEK